MEASLFTDRVNQVRAAHETLLTRPNPVNPEWSNGVFERFRSPVITSQHTPLEWRYDFDPEKNPFFMERMGINATTNPGAFYWKGKCHLVVRVEGYDRKSFFGIAESANGVDNFRFWDEPLDIPPLEGETNLYDMRVTFHEDGWIYGTFCTESKDPTAKPDDLSSAVAQAGIARTKDFRKWERLPNLSTPASQQRNVVLHEAFVDSQYGFYTRPMDGFIDVGSGGGIGWTLCADITVGKTGPDTIIAGRHYHGIMEAKNGDGPPPLKTEKGWLHLAHGVRNCAAGLRYVLYLFLADLNDPAKVIVRPGGHFLAPFGVERSGDVSNVTFANGWIRLPDETVLIYYGGSDTRCYVARSSIAQLLDWCLNTPEDGLTTHGAVRQRLDLIRHNHVLLQ